MGRPSGHSVSAHWDRPRIVWYQGGHVTFRFHAPVRQLLADAFRESGLTTV
jgi:hypothetical protein